MRLIRSTPVILAACAIIWVALVLRNASDRRGPEDFVATVPQSEIQAFARKELAALQVSSFTRGIELCGIIFEDSDGDLYASRPSSGGEAECDISFFDEPGMAPVASFHTHGAFAIDYDSEVPSETDLQSDFANRMDGYVATPGGRFWRIDWEERIAIQICGEGCLPSDPEYRPCSSDEIALTYSLEDLQQRAATVATVC